MFLTIVSQLVTIFEKILIVKNLRTALFLYFSISQTMVAKAADFSSYIAMPYAEARQLLIKDGWHVVRNPKIEESSMFAQNLHASQFEEVQDCISMERDQCEFILAKGKQAIVVTTKDKNFTVESIKKAKLN
jgi:hypothetical protein